MSTTSFFNYAQTNMTYKITHFSSLFWKRTAMDAVIQINKDHIDYLLNLYHISNEQITYDISGGFAAYCYMSIVHPNLDHSKKYYDDVDVYVNDEMFQLLKTNVLNNNYDKKLYDPSLHVNVDTSLINQDIITMYMQVHKTTNFKIQFLNKKGCTINQVCDSFDIVLCKIFIEVIKGSIQDVMWISTQLIANRLELCHVNPLCPDKSIKRFEKYLSRYNDVIERIVLPKEEFIKMTKQASLQEKTSVDESFNENGKEVCSKCNVELKWTLMQLKCPQCNKVYAG